MTVSIPLNDADRKHYWLTEAQLNAKIMTAVLERDKEIERLRGELEIANQRHWESLDDAKESGFHWGASEMREAMIEFADSSAIEPWVVEHIRTLPIPEMPVRFGDVKGKP